MRKSSCSTLLLLKFCEYFYSFFCNFRSLDAILSSCEILHVIEDPKVKSKLKLKLKNQMSFNFRNESPIRILNASTEVSGSQPEETIDGLHYSEKVIKVVSSSIYSLCTNILSMSEW